jgi:hypothetical protein
MITINDLKKYIRLVEVQTHKILCAFGGLAFFFLVWGPCIFILFTQYSHQVPKGFPLSWFLKKNVQILKVFPQVIPNTTLVLSI